MFQLDPKTSGKVLDDLMAEMAQTEKAKKADGPPIVMRSVVANENRPSPVQAPKIPTYDGPEARNIAWEDDEFFYVFED